MGLLGLAGEDGTLPQRLEPKTFLASERTFLSWVGGWVGDQCSISTVGVSESVGSRSPGPCVPAQLSALGA